MAVVKVKVLETNQQGTRGGNTVIPNISRCTIAN